MDLEHTLFVVASKSGGTIEVVSLYQYFRAKMEKLFGEMAGNRFIAITDPGTNLGKLASEQGFRRVFLNPADIGGRFSSLSYFGSGSGRSHRNGSRSNFNESLSGRGSFRINSTFSGKPEHLAWNNHIRGGERRP